MAAAFVRLPEAEGYTDLDANAAHKAFAKVAKGRTVRTIRMDNPRVWVMEAYVNIEGVNDLNGKMCAFTFIAARPDGTGCAVQEGAHCFAPADILPMLFSHYKDPQSGDATVVIKQVMPMGM